MQIEAIRALVNDELSAVDNLIDEQLDSDIALIGKISKHLIQSGGKRLRPILLLLSALCFDYPGKDHIKLGAVLEFVHSATLLHDDVVDASHLRRGQQTANDIWGNQASVLVGDYLYSRAFQLMVDVEDLRVLRVIANATNTISRGEILQLIHCNDPATTEQEYMDIIRGKTAALFSVAAEIGAMLGQANDEQISLLRQYGLHLGTAFQLIDDLLDYSSSSETVGKNIGDDLAEGKPTLPLLYALHHGTPEQRELIEKAIKQGGLEHIDEIKIAITDSQAIDYTQAAAEREVQAATSVLQQINPSKYRDGLLALAEFALHRSF